LGCHAHGWLHHAVCECGYSLHFELQSGAEVKRHVDQLRNPIWILCPTTTTT
jgi:hypothetical protein